MSFHFEPLALRPTVLEGLAATGFSEPTDVQQQAIPPILARRDAIVQAKTGSGKTLAYGLPLLSLIKPGPRPQALVVVPTRELAIQIGEAIASVGQPCGLRVVTVYGGMGLRHQRRVIQEGQDIVVGTPGRLKDMVDQDKLDLSGVRILVLDEADRMFELGFRKDLEFLLVHVRMREQTLLFSATIPPEIAALARRLTRNPVRVKLESEHLSPSELSHWYLRVPRKKRFNRLVSILRKEQPARAIVFTEMKHETEQLAKRLELQGHFKAGFLNGNMPQIDREKVLARFRSGDLTYLVATDIAARGLDIDGVSHVIHYALPSVVETYVHRSGRTARNGTEGKAIMLVVPEQEAEFEAIQRRIRCEEYLAPQGPDHAIAPLDADALADQKGPVPK
ncbi:MAG TPA: DEAD/DEAH box helicase [Pantanalinema sp.]